VRAYEPVKVGFVDTGSVWVRTERGVEKLWTLGEFPVDPPTPQIFLAADARRNSGFLVVDDVS